MASIGKDRNGRKRILFVAENGSRKTIRLGKTTLKQALAFKVKLESLVAARHTGNPDEETARWVARMSDEMHAKIAAVGLLAGRVAVWRTTRDGRCHSASDYRWVLKLR